MVYAPMVTWLKTLPYIGSGVRLAEQYVGSWNWSKIGETFTAVVAGILVKTFWDRKRKVTQEPVRTDDVETEPLLTTDKTESLTESAKNTVSKAEEKAKAKVQAELEALEKKKLDLLSKL